MLDRITEAQERENALKDWVCEHTDGPAEYIIALKHCGYTLKEIVGDLSFTNLDDGQILDAIIDAEEVFS